MGIEQKINYKLNKYPVIKKMIKSIYQHVMYIISPKIKCEGNITRISLNDPYHEYFFGYYDKSPWDITDRYMLCMKANNTWSCVCPKEKADILLIDTALRNYDRDRVRKIADTNAWNVQQSCMLQWLGPDFSSHIIYNDYRNRKYVAIIKDIKSGDERIINAPVYTVSADGKIALTLDFSRLHNLRPGYGYNNVPEKTEGMALPDSTAVWKIDLESGIVSDLLTYKDFATFQPRPEMLEAGAVHKVNHLMLSPNGKRFMVLYRWFIGERKYTRLITCNVDGSDMYVLSDDDMVSHCIWKDNKHILAFENKKDGGIGYYLMKDKTQFFFHCWPKLISDGHPSYSPNGRWIVTDSYPDRARIQYLRVMKEEDSEPQIVAKVFSPFKYDNDTRCDLHPRWNHAGNAVCFDSVYEGHRGLYVVNLNKKKAFSNCTSPQFSIITPVYNSYSLMDKFFTSLENQTYKNFEVIIVDDCSTDGTYEKIVRRSEKSNLMIRVFRNKKNSGAGIARNNGIKEAIGEYIIFIDSDDYIADNTIEKLSYYNSDMIFFNYCTIGNKKINFRKTISIYGEDASKENILVYCTSSVCGKAIKRAVVISNDIQFPNLVRYEDWVFMSKSIIASNTFSYIQEALYFYVDNSSSIVHMESNKAHEYSCIAFDMIERDLRNISFDVAEALFAREVVYITAKEIVKYLNKEQFWCEMGKLQKKYPKWGKNKYIKGFSLFQKTILSLLADKLYLPIKMVSKI